MIAKLIDDRIEMTALYDLEDQILHGHEDPFTRTIVDNYVVCNAYTQTTKNMYHTLQANALAAMHKARNDGNKGLEAHYMNVHKAYFKLNGIMNPVRKR